MKVIYIALVFAVVFGFQNCDPIDAKLSLRADVDQNYDSPDETDLGRNSLFRRFADIEMIQYTKSGGYPAPMPLGATEQSIAPCPENADCATPPVDSRPCMVYLNSETDVCQVPPPYPIDRHILTIEIDHSRKLLRVSKGAGAYSEQKGSDAYAALRRALVQASWEISNTPDFIADSGNNDLRIRLRSGVERLIRFPDSEQQYKQLVFRNGEVLQALLETLLQN